MPKSVSFTEHAGGRSGRAGARPARRASRPANGTVLDEHVLGLDVAMNDAIAVRVRERREELERQGGGDLGRHRAALLQELAQGRAADELDDEVLLGLVGLADVEDLDDVRVAELGHRLRLGVEARDDLARIAQVGMDDLDGDLAPEAAIARAVHGRHPAVADLLEDLVFGELGHPPDPCRRVLHGRASSLHQDAAQAGMGGHARGQADACARSSS